MFKRILLSCLLLFAYLLRSQNISFTIHTISPGNTITCANPAVNIVASTSYTGNVNFLWKSSTYTLSGSSVFITAPGTYSVVAYGSTSQSLQKVFTISINTLIPSSTVQLSSSIISCSNPALAQFNATSSVASEHRFISPYGGTYTTNTTVANYRPGSPGTYTHEVISPVNGCKRTHVFTITATGFPKFDLTTNNNFVLGCSATSVAVLSINNGTPASGSGAVSYTVFGPQPPSLPPGGLLSNLTSYSIYVPGTYTVVTRDNSSLCDARSIVSIVQNTVGPDLKIVIPDSILSCRIPQLQLLAASSLTNTVYNWSWQGNPGGTTNPTILASINPAAPNATLLTTYTLVGLNDINQCTSTLSIPVFQNIFKPNPLVSGSTLTLTCANPTLLLNNQSTTGIPPGNFPNTLSVTVTLWDPPLPQSQATIGQSYPAYTSGVYTVHVIDQNNGCRDTANIAVLDGKVYPVINSSAPPFCLNNSVATVAIYPLVTGAGENYTYTWSAPDPTLQLPSTATVSTNATGIYSVNVTSTLSGCSTLAQVLVSNCITSILNNGNLAADLLIYPNPSTGIFKISGNKTEDLVIRVYDLPGMLVEETDLSSGKLDIGALQNGIYILHILQNGKVIGSRKLIKE